MIPTAAQQPTLTTDQAREIFFPDMGKNQFYAGCHRYLQGDHENGIPCRKIGSRIYVLTGPLRAMVGIDS